LNHSGIHRGDRADVDEVDLVDELHDFVSSTRIISSLSMLRALALSRSMALATPPTVRF
jgi:hypothetical protein